MKLNTTTILTLAILTCASLIADGPRALDADMKIVHVTNITNTISLDLPATVTGLLCTNVVSGDNSSGCNMCFDENGNHNGYTPAVLGGAPCLPYHPATEKWIITNIVHRTTLTVMFNGKALTYTEEIVRSSTTNRWKLTKEWKPD